MEYRITIGAFVCQRTRIHHNGCTSRSHVSREAQTCNFRGQIFIQPRILSLANSIPSPRSPSPSPSPSRPKPSYDPFRRVSAVPFACSGAFGFMNFRLFSLPKPLCATTEGRELRFHYYSTACSYRDGISRVRSRRFSSTVYNGVKMEIGLADSRF
jgi:hypothetical protein